MIEFTDSKDRKWHPVFDLDAMERFDRKSQKGFFELAAGGMGELLKVHNLIALFWEAVNKEAHEQNIDYANFRAGLVTAQNLLDAVASMKQAISEFFPEAAGEGKKGRPTDGETSTS